MGGGTTGVIRGYADNATGVAPAKDVVAGL